jgi:hypothetical protein
MMTYDETTTLAAERLTRRRAEAARVRLVRMSRRARHGITTPRRPTVDQATRTRLIERYRGGARVVREALAGASDTALDARPALNEWTAREVVHHLADAEMTSAIRLRRLLAEERPHIGAYDEVAFARALHYDRPIGPSLDAFESARAASADLLERLGDDEWSRIGTHDEVGEYGVETWLTIYADHAHDHAAQIERALEQAGAADTGAA